MKLAEALIERKELNTKIARLKARLLDNVLIQEGDTLTEDPSELMREFNNSFDRLTKVVNAINKTNVETKVEGKSLAQLIVERDLLIKKASIMREIVGKASNRVDRYSRSEILILTTIDVNQYQKQIDDISAEARKLDSKIQFSNWNTEVELD